MKLFMMVVFSVLSAIAQAGVINYSGSIFDPFTEPEGDFVVVGTFAPSFDPYLYKFVYGADELGNMPDGSKYSQAVADGNFNPIGDGRAGCGHTCCRYHPASSAARDSAGR